eukprot:UN04166
MAPQERKHKMAYYKSLMALTTKACQPFLSIAIREAVSCTMGLAGYPTVAWSDQSIVDQRSVRELELRKQERKAARGGRK